MAVGIGRMVATALVGAVVVGGGAAPAQGLPGLPPRVAEVLDQFGIATDLGRAPWLGDWDAAFRAPVKNPQFVALMERARAGDVVLPLDNALFAPENAGVGHWHSEFFLDNYGTALFLAEPFKDGPMPVVLVPGINGSARDFSELVAHLEQAGYQPVYFVYPSGMPLAAAARQLDARLEELAGRHRIERFAVIAHSMGGLVAVAALGEADVPDALPGWRTLIAISSPFAGVETAQYAERLPRHPPSWDDLGGRSAFLRKLHTTRFPSDMSFYLFFGARSSRRVLSALGNNDGVLTLDAVVGSPLSRSAQDVFGFYEDHVSILAAPLVFRRLDEILSGPTGG